MQDLKIILVDDEVAPIEVLKIKINSLFPMIKIAGIAASVEEAYDEVKKNTPDVVFLDANLPDGSGFDLLDRFDKVDFEVIFASGYSEFALKAIQSSACGYLLKPFKDDEIVAALNAAIDRIKLKRIENEYFHLLEKIDATHDESITLNLSSGKRFIKIKDIVRCEGWDKYTYIHLVDGEKILSTTSIGKFKDQLENYHFFDCHRSHLINSKYVIGTHEGYIELVGKIHIPLARRKKSDFQKYMKKN